MDAAPDLFHSNAGVRKKLLQRAIQAAAIGISAVGTVRFALREDLPSTLHFIQYVPPMILFAAALLSSRLDPNCRTCPWDIGLDLVAIGISGSRMIFTETPFSGHMVLLTYGLLASNRRGLRLCAAVLLMHTTFLKLAIWGDYSTWMTGACIGMILAIAERSSTQIGIKALVDQS